MAYTRRATCPGWARTLAIQELRAEKPRPTATATTVENEALASKGRPISKRRKKAVEVFLGSSLTNQLRKRLCDAPAAIDDKAHKAYCG